MPPALNSDEVAIGYNAYSVFKTGRDEYGKAFPATFRSFDDYKMPVYVYMVAGSMRLFGFSDFSVRFPSALLGTLTVALTFLFVEKLFKEKNIHYALTSSFLLAISPWSLMFSRSGYEANVAVFFVVLGMYLALLGLDNGWFLLLSSVALSLSVWTYLSARIFVPLLLVGFAVIYRRELLTRKMAVIAGVVIGVVLLLPIAKMSLSSQGQMRALGVSAFGNPNDLAPSLSWMTEDIRSGYKIFTIFDNRRIEYVRIFLKGYFSHFDPNFLFMDKSIEKYRAPGVGLLYLFELPFLCFGAYKLTRKHPNPAKLVFWWLLVAPVAAAFTLQLPHPVRTLVFLPTFQIISAVGLVEFANAVEKNKKYSGYLLYMIAVLFMAMNIIYFIHQYFVHLPIDDASYWYVGRKEMVDQLKLYEPKYDRIIVSNALDFPYIFFLYYYPADPSTYLKQGGTVSGGFNEQRNTFGKYEFRSINSSLIFPKENVLYVGLPTDVWDKSLIINTIYYPSGTPAIVFFR